MDAGNLFFKKVKESPGIPMENAKLTAEIILESFNAMGCDVLNLGSKDFSGGLDFLLSMEAEANFPFISANIYNADGVLLFRPYQVIKKENTSIGFIGVTSAFEHFDLQIGDPVSAINEYIEEVDANSDITVLLFSALETDLSKIRNSDLPLDLIVQSNSTRRGNDGGQYNIPIFSLGNRGKYVYQFDYSVSGENNKILDLSSKQKQLQDIEKELKRKKGNSQSPVFNPGNPEERKRSEEINKLLARRKALEESIRLAENTLIFKRIEMGKTVADRPDILLIVDAGKEKLKKVSSPQPPTVPNRKNKSNNNLQQKPLKNINK